MAETPQDWDWTLWRFRTERVRIRGEEGFRFHILNAHGTPVVESVLFATEALMHRVLTGIKENCHLFAVTALPGTSNG